MKFTALKKLKKLFKRSAVNISGSPIIDVAGNSHTHYGDIYKKLSIHRAGNQLITLREFSPSS